jgi:hypothetical protein
MRNSMRLSSGTPELRSTIAFCTSIAQRTAVDHAAELDDRAVAGPLDDAALVNGEGGIDQIAAQRSQARERALFVRAREPAVTDHVRDQDRRYFPRLAHGANAEVARSPGRGGLGMVRFHAALAEGMEAGSASPRSAREAYPRRADHNTVTEGGIDNGPRLARQDRPATWSPDYPRGLGGRPEPPVRLP